IKSPVTLADIYPTIAEYLEQDAGKIYGRSMVNSDSASRNENERIFISTSIIPPLNRRYVGVRSTRSKYIRQESVDGSEVLFEKYFDLLTDPREQCDILGQRPGDVEKARDEILRIYGENYAKREVLSTEEEEVLMQRFRSLGYE
ncbi:MAG: hypothetical protein ACRDF4_08065, partial [Rhabdochlamydiaceae bacterium]